MIKNTAITDEINEQAADDPAMRIFLNTVIESETENYQWRKIYDDALKEAMERRE